MGQQTRDLTWRLECLFELESMPDVPWAWSAVSEGLHSADIEQRELAIAVLATSRTAQAEQTLYAHLAFIEREPWLQRFCQFALGR